VTENKIQNNFLEQNHYCACGKTHTLSTKAIFFGQKQIEKLTVFLEHLAPPLASILIITDDKAQDATNRQFEKKIARLGYRVKCFVLDSAIQTSVQVSKQIKVDEEVRAIVAVGGETAAEMAKFIGLKHGLKVGVILTSPNAVAVLSPSAKLLSGDTEKIYQVSSPKVLLCDTDFFKTIPQHFVAAAFGELVSKCISLLDYYITAKLCKLEFCHYTYEKALDLIDKTINAFSEKIDAEFLAKSAIEFSLLTQYLESSRIVSGAEAQSASVTKLLFLFEKRELPLNGELQFLLSIPLIRLYIEYFNTKPSFFVPPPNNIKRLEHMVEYLGIEEKNAVKLLRPIKSCEEIKEQMYKLNEYSSEFKAELELSYARIKRAEKIFKRIYKDDGYKVFNILEPHDVALSISLAPDISLRNSFLSVLKDMGLLDEFM